MKLAIQFGVSTYTSSNEDWASALTYAVEAERLGVEMMVEDILNLAC